MHATELIRAVEQAGGHLEPDGGDIVVEAPMPLPGFCVKSALGGTGTRTCTMPRFQSPTPRNMITTPR